MAGGSQASQGVTDMIELNVSTLSRTLGEVLRRHARPAGQSNPRGFGMATLRALIAQNPSVTDAAAALQKLMQHPDLWFARVFVLQRKLHFGQPIIYERQDAVMPLAATRPAPPVPSLKEYVIEVQNRIEVCIFYNLHTSKEFTDEYVHCNVVFVYVAL